MIDALRKLYFRAWRPALLVVFLGLAAYFVFFHQLGSLVPGYSTREIASQHSAEHAINILNNPLNAPYKILVYVGHYIGHHGLLATRVAAALFGVLSSVLFYLVVRRWFSYRIAFLSTVLFATSSGLMHVARLGSPLVLQLAPLLLLAVGIWFTKTRHRAAAFYLCIAVLATLLYIPGLVWFELFGLLMWRKSLGYELHGIGMRERLFGWLLGLALLVPLIRAFILAPHQLMAFAGLPQHLHSIGTMAANFGHTLLAIGIQSEGTPDLWLGHAPLLDIIQLILAAIGIYACARRFRSGRNPFLLLGLLLGIVLISFGGPVAIGLLLPFLYLLVASGLFKLLNDWLAVFPRNPIARFTGIFIACALVFFSVLYQWRAYFIAWPHNTTTRATFRHHQTD